MSVSRYPNVTRKLGEETFAVFDDIIKSLPNGLDQRASVDMERVLMAHGVAAIDHMLTDPHFMAQGPDPALVAKIRQIIDACR